MWSKLFYLKSSKSKQTYCSTFLLWYMWNKNVIKKYIDDASKLICVNKMKIMCNPNIIIYSTLQRKSKVPQIPMIYCFNYIETFWSINLLIWLQVILNWGEKQNTCGRWYIHQKYWKNSDWKNKELIEIVFE